MIIQDMISLYLVPPFIFGEVFRIRYYSFLPSTLKDDIKRI